MNIKPARILILIVSVLAIWPAGLSLAQSTDAVMAASNAAGRTVREAVLEEDGEKLASVFTENATLIAPDGRQVQGRTTIRASATLLFLTLGGGELNRTRLTMNLVDGVAYETGSYEFLKESDNKKRLPIKGKYVVVWKQEQNVWKIDVAIGLF